MRGRREACIDQEDDDTEHNLKLIWKFDLLVSCWLKFS